MKNILEKSKKLPRHIAIIMDGNRRWAREKGLPVVAGHDFVAEKLIEPLVDKCIELCIPYITFWAFSTENWQRSRGEVEGMMRIFRKGLQRNAKRLFEKGVRLKIIGDMEKFPDDIAEQATGWVEKSRNNKKVTVTFALNYGGRDELLRAICRLYEEIQDSKFKIQNLNQEIFTKFLDTEGLPDPDLIIRSGGEKRLSGFMSWQSAYSELYFTETLMPEFNQNELDRAIEWYQKRQRRFGK